MSVLVSFNSKSLISKNIFPKSSWTWILPDLDIDKIVPDWFNFGINTVWPFCNSSKESFLEEFLLSRLIIFKSSIFLFNLFLNLFDSLLLEEF